MWIKDRAEFDTRLIQAVHKTRNVLADCKQGKATPGTAPQYEYILKQLELIQSDLQGEDLPDENARMDRSIGYILTDNWDPKDTLGIELLYIDHYFLKKI